MKRVLLSILLVALFIPSMPDAGRAAKSGRRGGAPLPARRGVLLKGLLPEGLRMLIWYDPDLEVETSCLAVAVGAQHDMEHKQGAAALVADVIRNGHSGVPAAELAHTWEEHGFALESRSDEDATVFLLSQPPGDFAEALTAFGQLVSRCEMREEDVQRELERAAWRFDARRPWSRAEVELRRLMFGQFAYHRLPQGTPETLANVTREICRGYYSQYYRPNNSVLVVTGPVAPEDVRRAATRAFEGWHYGYVPPASPNEPAPLDAARTAAAPGIEGVCAVLAGAVVPHLRLEDRLALEVCAELLTAGAPDSGARSAEAVRRGGLRRHRLCDEVRLSWTTGDAALRGSVQLWLSDLRGCASGVSRGAFEQLREACLDRLLSDERWTSEAARATLFGWPVDTPDDFTRVASNLDPEQVAGAARRWIAPERWGLVSTAGRSELEAAFARGGGAGSAPAGEP